jgi:hypothetical protein
VRTPSGDASASYAAEVARLLWPEPWDAPYVTRSRQRTRLPHRDAYLFPSERHPRLLVPVDVPGSSRMLQRLGKGRSALSDPMRRLLERSVHSRAFALTRWPTLRVPGTDPAADSIEQHLAHCFETEVRVGVMLGTRRVNQKPVLQVFDLEGTLRGFAKVGHNDLTADLVRREAQSLAIVSEHEPRSFRAPRVLHHGRWAGLEILVISPLATDPRDQVTPVARLTAMREVSHLAGTTSNPLATSGFWTRLRGTVALLAENPEGGRLETAADDIERRHGADPVSLGGWHGDWGFQNMAMGDGVLQLWDWERYDSEVPIGFDGLHFAAQRVRPWKRDERRQEGSFLRSVPEILTALGVGDPDQHSLTLRLYLLEVAVRYVDALRHGATPKLRGRTSWVLSLLERHNDHPSPARSEGRQ